MRNDWADDLLSDCQMNAWSGRVWRAHRRQFPPLDSAGSTFVSGRFHRAPDRFAQHECWRAIYVSLLAEISLAEIFRHTQPSGMPRLNEYRITEVAIHLNAVIDCRNAQQATELRLTLEDPYDYAFTQRIAKEAINRGAEAILVPSATRLGDNLVIFPDQLRPDSRLDVIGSRDPVLYVERE